MKLNLYHGSERIIQKPKFGLGNPKNDFGLGFYCTLDNNLALEWASSLDKNGYSNNYEIDTTGLKILDLTSDDYTILHWLTLLIQNRTFDIQSDFGQEAYNYLINTYKINSADFDIIKGYRADDSYFSFAQDFLNNLISLKTLSSAMNLGELGIQYVIKSKTAFSKLIFLGAEKSESTIWYAKKQLRDEQAREKYRKLRTRPYKRGNIYIMQIIDGIQYGNDAPI